MNSTSKSGYITKDVRLDVHQIETITELVGQARREAADNGGESAAQLYDEILDALQR